MTAEEFESRIADWAHRQPDLEALIQIGSRAQPVAEVDQWSDWDYHFVTRRPDRYQGREWPARIAPCWCAHLEKTERGVVKISAVFEDGLEADFVPLAAWQVKLACWAMRHPGARRWFPPALQWGVHNLRLIAGPGHRVIIGGAAWERRLEALKVDWPANAFTGEDFQRHVTAFWRHAVWVFKKSARGELRAAARWHVTELTKHVYALLGEEARLAGRTPRPEARKAEQWLDEARLRQTAVTLAPDRRVLAQALLGAIDLFTDASRKVAERHGFNSPGHAEVEQWLRAELKKLR